MCSAGVSDPHCAKLVSLALLLARIPTNGATATSFGNDYCQDLGDRGVTCTLASSCTPATELLLPNGATTIPLDVCTLTTGCTITPPICALCVPSPSGVSQVDMRLAHLKICQLTRKTREVIRKMPTY